MSKKDGGGLKWEKKVTTQARVQNSVRAWGNFQMCFAWNCFSGMYLVFFFFLSMLDCKVLHQVQTTWNCVQMRTTWNDSDKYFIVPEAQQSKHVGVFFYILHPTPCQCPVCISSWIDFGSNQWTVCKNAARNWCLKYLKYFFIYSNTDKTDTKGSFVSKL